MSRSTTGRPALRSGRRVLCTSFGIGYPSPFSESLHLRIATIFTLAARLEAISWAGLLIGMFLKYGIGATEFGVWLFGRVHGAAFLLYFIAAIVTALRLRWPWWAAVLSVLAAIPPLVTLPLELWFRRRGLLASSANTDSAIPEP